MGSCCLNVYSEGWRPSECDGKRWMRKNQITENVQAIYPEVELELLGQKTTIFPFRSSAQLFIQNHSW